MQVSRLLLLSLLTPSPNPVENPLLNTIPLTGIVDTDWMSFKAPVKSRFDMDEEYQMSSSDDSSVISSEDEASVIDRKLKTCAV